MRSLLAVARRVLAQFRHDPRTLGIMLVAPCIVLWLFSVLLGVGDYAPRIATVNLPEEFQTSLTNQTVRITDTDYATAEDLIARNETDAVLTMDGSTLSIQVEGADASKTGATMKQVQAAIVDMQKDKADDIRSRLDSIDFNLDDDLMSDMSDTIRSQIAEAAASQKRSIEDKITANIASSQADMTSQMDSALDGMTFELPADIAAQLPTAARAKLQSALTEKQKEIKQQVRDKVAQMQQEQTAKMNDVIAGVSFDIPDSTVDEIQDTIRAKVDAKVSEAKATVPSFDEIMPITDFATTYYHGNENWTSFDFYGPVFIGIFIFVFVFLTSSMSLLTERSGGTVNRLLASPVKSWQIVGGYVLGFGLLTLIQSIIILWACIALIGFPNEGSLPLVVLITVSMALVSLTLGLLVSGLAHTPFQVIQLMILFVVPQILLSGIFDLSQTPGWMQAIAACFPLGYGAEALRDVMLRGAGFGDVVMNFSILWGFIVAFFALSCLNFRKKRAPRPETDSKQAAR